MRKHTYAHPTKQYPGPSKEKRRDQWIYSACMCVGLVWPSRRARVPLLLHRRQAEYSRDLLIRSAVTCSARSTGSVRLDIPMVRASWLKNRPHRNRAGGTSAQQFVIEKRTPAAGVLA
jgi:hypothetical protein